MAAAPILITTNKSVRDWTELLAGDEVLATAILDRRDYSPPARGQMSGSV